MLLEMGHPRVFHLKLVHIQPLAISHFLLTHFGPLMAPAASCPHKLELCICLPACLLSFWGSSLPRDFSSLKDIRRNVDFQFVTHFSCEDEKEEFSTLHLGRRSRSPLNTFKNKVVMYFMLSYLKPLEKFRSKGQIISCVSNLHDCLNYPFCVSGHMTFGQSQNSSGCEGRAAGWGARRLISWAGCEL